jgi:hypothetical protein
MPPPEVERGGPVGVKNADSRRMDALAARGCSSRMAGCSRGMNSSAERDGLGIRLVGAANGAHCPLTVWHHLSCRTGDVVERAAECGVVRLAVLFDLKTNLTWKFIVVSVPC